MSRIAGTGALCLMLAAQPAVAQGVLPAGGASQAALPTVAAATPLPAGKAAGLVAAQQLVGGSVVLAGLGGVAVAAVALVMSGGDSGVRNHQPLSEAVATTGTR